MTKATVTAAQLRIDVLKYAADVEAIRGAWRDLHAAVNASHMTTYEWCMTGWSKVAAARQRRLAVVAGWRGDKLILLWPLAVARVSVWTVAQPLGSETHDSADILIAPGEDAVAAFAEAHRAVARSADVLRFAFVHADSRLFDLLGEGVTGRATATHVPRIEFQRFSDIEGWRNGLGNGTRRNLSRRWRRIDEAGAVAIELATTRDRVAEGVGFLFDRKLAWCAATGREPVGLDDPAYRAFIDTVAQEALATGALMMPFLIVSGALVAVELNFLSGQRMDQWMAAHDPAWSTMSPGALLLCETIAWCFSRQIEICEMGPHDHGYKDQWCPHQVAAAERVVAPLTRWGQVFRRAREIRHLVRSSTA